VFSPDGTRVLICERDSVRVLDAATGRTICERKESRNLWHTCGAFAPDGKTFVTGTYGGIIQFWNAETAERIVAPGRHGGQVFPAIFSRDEKPVYTGCHDCIRTWNAQTGELLKKFGTPRALQRMSLSPDGALLVSVNSECEAEMWDTGRFEKLRTLGKTGSAVRSADFSPDGKVLILYEQEKYGEMVEPATGMTVCAWSFRTNRRYIISRFPPMERRLRLGR